MTRAYTPALRDKAEECARRLRIPLRQGIYAFMPGPQFETPAEIRALRLLGGDAVGMSTVPEAIAAAQCGMEVLGISCITNLAAGMVPDGVVSDDEVTVAAAEAAGRFCALIEAAVEALGQGLGRSQPRGWEKPSVFRLVERRFSGRSGRHMDGAGKVCRYFPAFHGKRRFFTGGGVGRRRQVHTIFPCRDPGAVF